MSAVRIGPGAPLIIAVKHYFQLKPKHIFIDESIEQMFIEISNQRVSFSSLGIDEQLVAIANLIENLLKRDGEYLKLDYSRICFEHISGEDVATYRKRLHCFRHASAEAIAERNSYSERQKLFLVDFGLIIVKAIHSLLEEVS